MSGRGSSAAQIEETILRLLGARESAATGKTICPSEAARALGGDDAFRPLMEPVREVAREMADRGALQITQGGQVVDARTAQGAIRLRLPPS